MKSRLGNRLSLLTSDMAVNNSQLGSPDGASSTVIPSEKVCRPPAFDEESDDELDVAKLYLETDTCGAD
jgi:hypothetical protein